MMANRNKRRAMPMEVTDRIEQMILDLNEQGIDCSKIARRTNVDRKSVYAYRNGTTTPDAFWIMRFCNEYEISADWLLDTKYSKTHKYEQQRKVDLMWPKVNKPN